MVDRNVENNEEILLAQIDLTGCSSGKILDYRDPDKRLQEEFFDCWQNPSNGASSRARAEPDDAWGRKVVRPVCDGLPFDGPEDPTVDWSTFET